MGDAHLDKPDQWATGEDAMTGKQAGFARKLASDTGAEFDPSMNKAEASKFIDEHKSQSSAGRSAGSVTDDATEKQKGFIAALEKRAGESVTSGEGLDKGQASDKIEALKAQT